MEEKFKKIIEEIDADPKQGKRSAFTQWVNRTGKKECDKIADEMSKVPINWKC